MPLRGAVALVLLGGLFSAIDAAINTVSKARVAELVRRSVPARCIWRVPQNVALHQSRCAASYRVRNRGTVVVVAYLHDRMALIRRCSSLWRS